MEREQNLYLSLWRCDANDRLGIHCQVRKKNYACSLGEVKLILKLTIPDELFEPPTFEKKIELSQQLSKMSVTVEAEKP